MYELSSTTLSENLFKMFQSHIFLVTALLGTINAQICRLFVNCCPEYDYINVFFIAFNEVPSDVVVAVGSQAEFRCVFTSTNAASLSWQKDGSFIFPSSKYLFSSNSLTINQTEDGDDGTYTCVVTDQVLSVTETRSAELDFAGKLYMQWLWFALNLPYLLFLVIQDSFVINPDSKTVQEGGSTTLFCVHSGSLPIATITWTKDGDALSSNSRLTISAGVLTHVDPPQTTSSLIIDPLAKSDSGMYACVATNSLLPNEAIYSSNAKVTVLGKYTCTYAHIQHISHIMIIHFNFMITIIL